MKQCSKCKSILDESEFYLDRKKNRRRPDCKACNRASCKSYNARNRDKVLAKKKEWRNKNSDKSTKYNLEYQAKMVERKKLYKEGKPCMDCGGVFPYYVMDFDHRDPTTKIKNPMDMPEHLVEDEISKCDLVCANCHRVRTHNKGAHYFRGKR